MRLREFVNNQASIAHPLYAGISGGALETREQSTQGRARCSVLDDASASPARQEFSRQPEDFYEPVEHMSFEFRASRACGPKHSLNPQAGREQLSQNGRERSIRREISE